VRLEPLLEHDGLLLFDRVRGEQPVPLDRAVGSRIVTLLGGLPLAVRIAAATAVSPPLQRRPLSHLADLLEDDDRRLSLLYDEERAVRSSFDVSYQGLRSDASRFFRRLGLLTASDFGSDLAAYTTGVTQDQASQLLDELAERQLVEVVHSGVTRYRLHELVRLYARERASQEDPSSNATPCSAVTWSGTPTVSPSSWPTPAHRSAHPTPPWTGSGKNTSTSGRPCEPPMRPVPGSCYLG
jgi:hypothetical protein